MQTFDFKTVFDIVQYLEKNYSNPTAFNSYEEGVWHHVSTEAFIYDLKRLTLGLVSLGLKKGDKVGVLANPSPHWTMTDLAIIIAGGVSVPLFANISDENFVYEVAQSNVRFLFVDGYEQWEMYNQHRYLFEHVVALYHRAEIDGATEFHDVLKAGERLWQDEPNLFEELGSKLDPNEVMTIVYTSGSTGVPKGVELTQTNLVHLANYQVYGDVDENDKYLSILPLAHVFARQINFIMMGWGASIYYLNELNQMGKVCHDIKPTMMIVVPRILEKLYSAFESGIEKGSAFKRKLALWAFKLASDTSNGLIMRFILRPLADLLIYVHVRRQLGDRWRVIICGGAALDPVLCQFLLNLGFPIYEGWGLTEASTTVVNQPGKVKAGTVGVPLPGVEIQIGENDEVLVGGPTVMRGYYRNPDATEESIDEEGWLHTADKGVIDEDGFLKLTGRIKEHFKLTTGEWVAPGRIEHYLGQSPLIDMAVVIGDKKKFAACLLFPDFNVLRRMKAKLNLAEMTDEEFLESDFITKEIQNLIDTVNTRINNWEKIQQYRFIMEPLTIENGELTPTLKIKRNVVMQKYDQIVADIYGEEVKV